MAEIAPEQTAARHRANRIAAVLFVSMSACATLISCLLSVRFLETVNDIKGRLNSLEQLSHIRPETSRKGLDEYLKSVCYVYTQYGLSYGGSSSEINSVSGTGFVVRKGIMATNRHIVEPWWDDDVQFVLHRAGLRFRVNKIVAFCPGISQPLLLTGVAVSNSDVALARFSPPAEAELAPLPLADTRPEIGEPVALLGYPAGVVAMLAKSSPGTRARIVCISDPIKMMRTIVAKGLLRPLATYGRLGDVTDYRLVYDAHTTAGGSGGPLIDSHGQVVAINAAFMNNFTGENLGVPVRDLKTLIQNAETGTRDAKSPAGTPQTLTRSIVSGHRMLSAARSAP
jgi:S1-C subfamily serine protease